jgi:beta-lactamase regulating signal transducer with metallopeptidase domain/predicted  nucleic acid-binding Zn-ribbon protein
MEFFEPTISPALVHTFGWTLVHSLWQLSALFFVYKIALWFCQHQASRRYLVGIGVLLAQAIVTSITFYEVYSKEQQQSPTIQTTVSSLKNTVIATQTSENQTTNTLTFQQESLSEQVVFWFSQHINWFVYLWLIGMFVMTLKLMGGYFYVQKLRWQHTKLVDDNTQRLFENLLERVGINHQVLVRESALVQIPLTIGYLQPIVLLPVGLATGLSQGEIMAILAHELAHIKRHDYLINIIQSIIEIIFFYHPLVWVISEAIREDRENCCDDLALAVCQNKIHLAKALTFVETFRQQSKSTLAMSLAGNKPQLLTRIQRILGVKKAESNNPVGIFGSILFLVLGICCINFTYVKAQTTKIVESTIQHLQLKNASSVTIENEERSTTQEIEIETDDTNPETVSVQTEVPKNEPDSTKIEFHRKEIERLQAEMEPYLNKISELSSIMGEYSSQMQLNNVPMHENSKVLQKYATEIGKLAQKQAILSLKMSDYDEDSKNMKNAEQEMKALEKQMKAIEQKMDAASKNMEAIGKEMEKHSTPMDSLGKAMEKYSKPLEKLGEEIGVHARAIETLDPDGKYMSRYNTYIRRGHGKHYPAPPTPPTPPSAVDAPLAPLSPIGSIPKAPKAPKTPKTPKDIDE